MTEFQPLFDLSPDPLCLLATNGHFKLVNKSFEEATGYSGGELTALNFFEALHHDDQHHIISKLGSLSTNATYGFEGRFRNTQNGYHWFLWNIKKLPDDTFYGSARNITQYKKQGTAQSFIVSDENYKLLFYSNPLPIVIYDMGSLAIIDVNTMASELYGYSREEFIKLTVKDVRPPKEVPLIIKAIKNRVYNPDIKNLGIWNHLKKNGDPIKVEVIGHSINYMGRHCMIVVCNDITAQSNTLRSLEQSIERFEYATEATSDIIWDWDLETNEVYYSNNMQKSFGHTPGRNVGDMRFFARHVHPEDKERVVLYPEKVKNGTQKYWTEKYRFRKADGEYAYVLDKGIVIRNENGIGIRMIGAMQDITELKNNELHIAEQNDRLIEIAQLNAHQTRRPVATILGLINLIDKATITDNDTLEALNHLDTAINELDMVIRRIIYRTVD